MNTASGIPGLSTDQWQRKMSLGHKDRRNETGLDLGDFMNLLCRSSALLLIGTHLLSLILLELSRKLSWQLTTRRIIWMNVDYATELITQEWRLAACSKWSDILFMADGLLRSMLLLKKTSMMIWESATLKMSLRMLSTRLEARNSGWRKHLIAWKRMSEAFNCLETHVGSINCLTCRKCYEFIYWPNDVEKWRMSEALIV